MTEPHRRGDALRVLTSMGLNEVYPMLYDFIKRGLADQCAYVRRIALTGLLKVRVSNLRRIVD